MAIDQEFFDSNIDMLENGSYTNRVVAANNLREIAKTNNGLDDSRAIARLIVALNDEDAVLVQTAAEALGETKAPRALNALIEKAKKIGNGDLSLSSIAIALGNYENEKSIDTLSEIINDRHPQNREKAIHALAKIGTDRALERLINRFSIEKDANLRRLIFEHIVQRSPIDGDNVRHEILNALSDQDDQIAIYAAGFLAKRGDTVAINTLLRFLQSSNPSISKLAQNAIFQITESSEVDQNIYLLQSETDTYKKQIAEEELRILLERLSARKDTKVEVSSKKENAADEQSVGLDEDTQTLKTTDQFVEPAIFDTDAAAYADQLGRQGYTAAIATWMSRYWQQFQKANAKSFVLHLHGQWGTGKTTLLNLLEKTLQPTPKSFYRRINQKLCKYLSKDSRFKENRSEFSETQMEWIVVRFNAWQQQHIEPIWWPLIDQVYRQSKHQLSCYFGSYIRRWYLNLRTWWWRFTKSGKPLTYISIALFLILSSGIIFLIFQLEIPGDFLKGLEFVTEIIKYGLSILVGFGAISSFANYIGRTFLLGSASSTEGFLQSGQDPLETIRLYFQKMLGWINRPVVVFIDDLDRCKKEYVVSLMESISTLLNDKRIFFIVAADRHWLYVCFEKVYQDFEREMSRPGRRLGYYFMQKLFQLSVMVPALEESAVTQYLNYLTVGDEETIQNKINEIREEASTKFAGVKSDSDFQDRIREVDQLNITDEDRELYSLFYKEAAVQQTASPEVEQLDEAYLISFASLLEKNPRAIKRLVSAFPVYRALSIYADINTFDKSVKNQFARWVILTLRWPQLAEHLERFPDDVEKFLESKPDFDDKELNQLVETEDIQKLLAGDFENSGQPINKETVEKFSGLAGF